jgi:hypothetical protein
MSQHFLLSPAARSLSLAKVARMSDQEAHDAFRLIRWADTKGEPVCPRCQCGTAYKYETRKLSGSARLARINLALRQGRFSPAAKCHRGILLAIAIFVNGAKGHSALQLSRDLDCQYKTAFVLAHKSAKRLPTKRRMKRFLAKSRSTAPILAAM